MRTEYDIYLGHKKRTVGRKDRLGNPIQFLLTFEQWKLIWDESGHSHERGSRKGQYCMARFDDLGHYEVGNVKIQLASENLREAALRGHPSPMKGKKGKPHSQETKDKISAARKNWSTKAKSDTDGRKKPMSEETKQKIRDSRAAKKSS